MFKAFYYSGICVWGYVILKDEYFMPRMMFCTGDLNLLESRFPFYEGPYGLKYYYLGTMGYHVYSMVLHVFKKVRNDYVEMILHHGGTVFLYGVSYYLNRIECGLIIMFLHDWADIFTGIARSLSETTYKKSTITSMIGLLINWGYSRLYVYPFVWQKVLSVEVYNGKYPIVVNSQGAFLIAL